MSDLQATDSSGSMELVVLGCDRKPSYITISRTTPLIELMMIWYKETRTVPDTMVFFYQGREIYGTSTPDLLGMQDFNSIEVRSVKDSKTIEDAEEDQSDHCWNREATLQPELMKLGIRFNGGHTRFFEVVSTDQLSLLFNTWSHRTRRTSDRMILIFRGVKIARQSTPKFLNMDDGAVIDAYRCSSSDLERASRHPHVDITVIMDRVFHNAGPLRFLISRNATLRKLYRIIARMTGRKRGEFSIVHPSKEGRIACHKTAEQLKIQNGDKLILQWRHPKAE